MPTDSWEQTVALFEVCGVCHAFIQRVRDNVFSSPYDVDKAYDEWSRHCRSPACKKYGKSRTHVGNGKHKGAWAFTLTKSPSDPYSVGDMLIAVRKIMSQKSDPVKSYAWYYEDKGKDENGDPIHPHIHGMYETHDGGRIERKHFKRAWKIWGEGSKDPKDILGAGFRGGYHREVRDQEAYSDYIKKDAGMHESKLTE